MDVDALTAEEILITDGAQRKAAENPEILAEEEKE